MAERNAAVQLAFTEGAVTLDAGRGEEALATEQIEAQVEGEDLTTGFSPEYLLDGLSAIDSPFVELVLHPAVEAGGHLRARRAWTASRRPSSATC